MTEAVQQSFLDLDEDLATRAAIVDALDETLFVEAGAGSGKTKALVDRIVALVTRRDVPMREIAAVTFTEKAAAELRDRIRRALEEAARGADAVAADAGHRSRSRSSTAPRCPRCTRSRNGSWPSIPSRPGCHPASRCSTTSGRSSRSRSAGRASSTRSSTTPRSNGRCCSPSTPTRRWRRCAPSHWRATRTGTSWPSAWGPSPILRPSPPCWRPSSPRSPTSGRAPRSASIPTTSCSPRCSTSPRGTTSSTDAPDEYEQLRLLTAGAPTGNLRHGRKENWPTGCSADDVRAEIGAVRTLVGDLAAHLSEVVVRRLAWELAQFTLREAEARRRQGELEFHDLLVLARAVLRDAGARLGGPPSPAGPLHAPAARRVPGHRPDPVRPRRAARVERSRRPQPPVGRARGRPGPPLRRRRPQAVHLPLPAGRHRRVPARPRRVRRVPAAAHPQLPHRAAGHRLRERGVPRAHRRRARVATRVRGPRTRARRRARRAAGRAPRRHARAREAERRRAARARGERRRRGRRPRAARGVAGVAARRRRHRAVRAVPSG